MPQNIRAGILALFIVIVVATTKFVFYKLSGSLAVLSEAWHSFSDVATTLLVLIAIVRQNKKEKKQQESNDELPEESVSVSRLGQILHWFRTVHTELKISLVIGLVLLVASATILWQVFFYIPTHLSAPITTGIVFIGLSLVSFFLYKFEESVGAETESAALIADSQHNRADMVITLATGVSLILYHFGWNVDRWLGLFISFYIFSFALELLVNTVKSIHYKRSQVVMEYEFSSIVLKVFQPESYQQLYGFISQHVYLGENSSHFIQVAPALLNTMFRWLTRVSTVIGLLFYLSTSAYTVNIDEQALLFRLGRIVNREAPIEPGLHWKLPFPFDQVERFQSGKIAQVNVGNTSSNKQVMLWGTDHGDNQMFISGDNNLFLPYVSVHYRISNIYDYYLNHRNDSLEQLISTTTYQCLNRIFSTTSFYDLMINKRSEWVVSLKEQLQQHHDALQTGIEIVELSLKDMHPPIRLARAFEDVIAAEQQRVTFLNNAKQGEILKLFHERVEASRTIAEAESYVVEKRDITQGEVTNYLMRYEGFRSNPEVTKEILRLQSVTKMLQDKKLYIVDPQSGITRETLYMEKYLFGRKNNE